MVLGGQRHLFAVPPCAASTTRSRAIAVRATAAKLDGGACKASAARSVAARSIASRVFVAGETGLRLRPAAAVAPERRVFLVHAASSADNADPLNKPNGPLPLDWARATVAGALAKLSEEQRKLALGALIGLMGGTCGALVGLGGAFLMVPLLTAWAKFTQHEANGTALVAVTVVGIVAAYSYSRRGAVDLVVAALLALSGLASSVLGAWSTSKVDASSLRRVFGGFLVFSALSIPLKAYLATFKSAAPAFYVAAGRPLAAILADLAAKWAGVISLLAIGVLSGFSSGFLGVSMGTLAVPALVVVSGLAQQLAQGTSLLAMILPSIAGSVMHYKLKNIRFDVAPGLAFGAIFGAAIGARLACVLPELFLKGAFTALLTYFGCRYIFEKKKKN